MRPLPPAHRVLAAWMLLALCGALPARAEPVGSVARTQGRAEAVAGETVRPLSPGAAVEQGEVLRTGDRARLEVRFADGTLLVLGEGAEMTVDAFVYDAKAKSGNALLRLASGAFLVETGAVARLPGRPLAVRTPIATIGVRGTRFWGGPLDGPFNVLLLDGAITVTTAGGSVVLATPGAGTTLPAAEAAPSTPVEWGEERVARAVASVAFER